MNISENDKMLSTLTNKEKVELVREILEEADISENPIYCCAGCDRIADANDEGFFCEICDKAVCQVCVSENFFEEQLCETCMERLCCGCGVKICEELCRFKCKGNKKECNEIFCGNCRKSGLNNVGKHVCKKH